MSTAHVIIDPSAVYSGDPASPFKVFYETRFGALYITLPNILTVLAAGTPSASNVLLGNGTWGTADAAIADGAKGDISTAAGVWTIAAGAVTPAKMANVASSTVFYRKTAATGVPEVQTLATLKTDLGLTGTNTGDQTSIVGLTGTLAQFNTALTDAEFVGCLFTKTSTTTVANTVTETSIVGTGVGSLSLGANYLTAGKTIRITASGYFTNDASGRCTPMLKLGSTVIATSSETEALTAVSSSQTWRMVIEVTCFTTGATGTVWSQGYFWYNAPTGSAVRGFGIDTLAARTLDTTAAGTLDLTLTWSNASAANSITCTNLIVEAVN